MTILEEVVGTADAYTRVKDLLNIEELILAVMRKRLGDKDRSVIVQGERVIGLRDALAYLRQSIANLT